ncbi:MAG: hypothetical protein IJA69_00175 [Clostridia bacterium]|nr:hypothetical protein [Clostridia bacterium]
MKKPILKFNKKFVFPRNPGRINLAQLKTHKTEPETGTSIAYNNICFIVNGKKTMFKNYKFGPQEISSFRALNEVICYLVGKQIGVKCAKCDFAKYHSDKKIDYGTISFFDLNNNQKTISLKKLQEKTNTYCLRTLEEIENLLKDYKKSHHINIDINKIMFDLYKLCVFDYLTMQCDRNTGNILFKQTYGRTRPINLELYPIIDNEHSFGTFVIDDHLFGVIDKLTAENILNNYHSFCRRITVRQKFAYHNQYEILDNNREIYEMVEYAKEKGYINFLKNAIAKYDITKIINKLKESGIKISKSEQEWYELCSYIQKQNLAYELIHHQESQLVFKNQDNEQNSTDSFGPRII